MSKPLVVNEEDAELEAWSDPFRGDVSFRTIFGGAITTNDFTAGVAELKMGGWLGHHRHDPSEIYHVVSGEGVLSVDGQDHPVHAGTSAYIPSNSEHAIRNIGNAPLRFFYAFAVESFESIEYHFTAEQSPPSCDG